MASLSARIAHDDYMTPKSAWEDIEHVIPKDMVLWECFYGDGQSGNHLAELGFEVIHQDVDFYTHDLGDVLVSNPPFSDCKNVMKRLAHLDKPFIMIMPSSKISTGYFRETFGNKHIQIIIPRKRIQFIKLVDGVAPKDYKSSVNFDCHYYCYKISLPKDITFL